MNDSTTFLIVRHPFERLLSAYKDKLLYAVPHSLHDKLGNKIIKRYRKKVKIKSINHIGAVPKINFLSEMFFFISFRKKMSPIRNGQHFPNLLGKISSFAFCIIFFFI